MAGGGQGAGPAQGTSGLPPTQEAAPPGGVAMQSSAPIDPARLQDIYNAKLASGQIGMGQTGGSFAPSEWANAQLQQMQRGAGPLPTGGQLGGAATYGRSFADGGQVGMSNYASPNQNFMQYQGQGQLNQPPTLSNALPTTQFMGGPDSGADYASANLGFDGSGSDGGVGGQPAPMATPLKGFADGGFASAPNSGGFVSGPALTNFGGASAPGTQAGGSWGGGASNFSPPQNSGFGQQPIQGGMTKPMITQMQPALATDALVQQGGQFTNMPVQGGGSSGFFSQPPRPPQGGPSNQLTQIPMPMPRPMPVQQGNKPLGLAQFQRPRGVQIAGNPTSQVLQRRRQR